MTPGEVRKLNMDNNSNIEDAKTDLGWQPAVSPAEGRRRSMGWVDHLAATLRHVRRPHPGWWPAILLGLGLTLTLALSGGACEAWMTHVGWILPRAVIQGIATVAATLHLAEGPYAFVRARRAGLPMARGRGLQTLLLGYPSLRLLLAELGGEERQT